MGNIPLELSIEELRELQKRGRSRTLPAGEVRRCQMILLLSEGFSYVDIKRRLGCNPATVSLWKRRFLEDRLPGLKSRHRGQRPSVRTPRLEARILRWTLRKPPDGSTHWSTRKLARKLKVNHSLVARVWKRAGLKPHRLDRYMASNDPNFEIKAADIIGLYLNPPQHAAVFCVDEKTAIQALDRRDRRLPLSPGRAERHGFEYRRHGTLSLLAAFETHSGQVIGKAVARHTSEQFVSFLQDLLHRVAKALAMILTLEVRQAFDLSQEPDGVRDAYGRNSFGQSLLLARRLVEAGSRFITAAGHEFNRWDAHSDNDDRHRRMTAGLDGSLPVLLEDLDQRGLLESTLVVVMGEFGRTAELNTKDGRDHWPHCWSMALGGGGIRGGQVVGASDERGAYVAEREVTLGDLFATIYKAFGIDWHKEYMTPVGRPVKIANSIDDMTGEPLPELI